MYKQGFTLFELLLVVALLFLVSVPTFSLGLSFFRTQLLDDTTNEILAVLRKAQTEAISQKHDNAYGVKLLEGEYILFEGDSYISRIESNDESYLLPSHILISGFDEIVFEKQSGLPSVSGSIVIVLKDKEESIHINEKGTLER